MQCRSSTCMRFAVHVTEDWHMAAGWDCAALLDHVMVLGHLSYAVAPIAVHQVQCTSLGIDTWLQGGAVQR